MALPRAKFYLAGEPGTLGAVCKLYFDTPGHEGCPFQQVCCADNLPVKDSPVRRIITSAGAETLEAMAEAVRATVKEDGDAAYRSAAERV
jgi:hypothetical protein